MCALGPADMCFSACYGIFWGYTGPGAGVRLLVSRLCAQEILLLVPTHQWLKLSLRASASPLAGRAGF